MTLIETLIAVTLLAMLGTVIATGTRIGGRAWGSAERQTAEIEDIDTVQALLRRMVARAQPAYASSDPSDRLVAFAGGPDAMTIVTPQPGGGDGGPWTIVRFHLARDGAGSALALSWRYDAPAAGGQAERQIRLLEHVDALSFGYFGPGAGGSAAGWRESWTDADRLPDLVRIGVRRNPPFQPWPDIVIATHVTANAGCVLNSTALSCSRGQP